MLAPSRMSHVNSDDEFAFSKTQNPPTPAGEPWNSPNLAEQPLPQNRGDGLPRHPDGQNSDFSAPKGREGEHPGWTHNESELGVALSSSHGFLGCLVSPQPLSQVEGGLGNSVLQPCTLHSV